MQINYDIHESGETAGITVTRDPGEKAIRKATGWGGGGAIDPDSAFWVAVLRKLATIDHPFGDLIKAKLESDGHMMGHEHQQYLRPRAGDYRKGHGWLIYWGCSALRDARDDFNAGEVYLNASKLKASA